MRLRLRFNLNFRNSTLSMCHSAEGCINHAYNESIRLGLPGGPINIFVTDFIEHKYEWIKDRRTSKTENSEVQIQFLLEGILVPWLANSGLLVVAGKNKVTPSVRNIHCKLYSETPSGFAINVNFLPGNVVPLDSIGVEVVQDSEADLENRIG